MDSCLRRNDTPIFNAIARAVTPEAISAKDQEVMNETEYKTNVVAKIRKCGRAAHPADTQQQPKNE